MLADAKSVYETYKSTFNQSYIGTHFKIDKFSIISTIKTAIVDAFSATQ